MRTAEIVACALLSAIWAAVSVQDFKTHKISNLGTASALALALGFRLGSVEAGDLLRYLIELGVGLGLVLAIYATGLIGGGDGKLMLSLLAWNPGILTWVVVLICLVIVGGGAMVWGRTWAWLCARREGKTLSFRALLRVSARYPLGGAIALAGMITVNYTVIAWSGGIH